MTFDEIRKNCVAGSTMFISRTDSERLYLGFVRGGNLVTETENGCGAVTWSESEIRAWKVEQPKKKLYVYRDTRDDEVHTYTTEKKWFHLKFLYETEQEF